jgi:hypothetical protein
MDTVIFPSKRNNVSFLNAEFHITFKTLILCPINTNFENVLNHLLTLSLYQFSNHQKIIKNRVLNFDIYIINKNTKLKGTRG